MSKDIFMPEGAFPVSATAGAVTTNGGVTCDNISLKEAQMVYIHVHLKQAVGHATAFTPLVGTSVATCATALPDTVEIYYGNTTTSSVALAEQTAAKLLTLGAGVTGVVHIIFKIDPSVLGSDYDCLGMTIGDSSQATNFASVVYWVVPRYANKVASNSATRFITD